MRAINLAAIKMALVATREIENTKELADEIIKIIDLLEEKLKNADERIIREHMIAIRRLALAISASLDAIEKHTKTIFEILPVE